MSTRKLIKRITLDMPIKDDCRVSDEETVGDYLNTLGKVPSITFVHGGIDYYVDRWSENSVCMQVIHDIKDCPKYIQLFNDKEDNFIQLVQYARFLDGTYLYEKLVDWKKVKSYETFEPGWIQAKKDFNKFIAEYNKKKRSGGKCSSRHLKK